MTALSFSPPGAACDASVRVKSCTIVIPGLNEELLIRQTVEEVVAAAKATLDDYEIILVNDGSTDRTGALMDELAARFDGVTVVHYQQPRGLSDAFRMGIGRARLPTFTLIPGDRAFEPDGIARLLAASGQADLVISYRTNQKQARSVLRYVLNRVYKLVMANLFSLRMTDVHSVNLYPVEAIRSLELHGEGVAFQIECLVKLLRRGATYVEVPVELTYQRQRHARTVSLRTLRNLIGVVLHLLVHR